MQTCSRVAPEFASILQLYHKRVAVYGIMLEDYLTILFFFLWKRSNKKKGKQQKMNTNSYSVNKMETLDFCGDREGRNGKCVELVRDG